MHLRFSPRFQCDQMATVYGVDATTLPPSNTTDQCVSGTANFKPPRFSGDVDRFPFGSPNTP